MNAKTRILDCALAELERTGTAAFSLRAVAHAAGLTPMAIYRHFANRDVLLAAVGEAAFAAWAARIEAIRATDPLDWLRKSARAYAVFALDEPARFEACFMLRTSVERIYPRDFAAGKSPVISRVMAQVRAAGLIGDPLEVSLFFWAELHGLVLLHRSGRFAMSRPAFLALCDRATDRLLAPPASR